MAVTSREIDEAYNRGDKELAKRLLEELVEEMKRKADKQAIGG